MIKITKGLSVFILAGLLFILGGCDLTQGSVNNNIARENQPMNEEQGPIETQAYYDRDDVALYIHTYNDLPPNYITKDQADDMNWSPQDREYVVGGDRFGNREGLLPRAQGRQYYEADVQAGYTDHRGPERIVYSNDGLIFYTDDHYDSFSQLY